MSIEIKGLYKDFDEISLFNDFSIDIQEGTITCILGPSGCGKTTLLNIIGSILQPDKGLLTGFEDKVLSYIFQDPRLLPWKTVKGNIEFVLSKDIPAEEREKLTNRFIRLVELEGFENYYPSKLSGGMRQRVSIARAFASPSDIILMDEPLKGLDIKLKLNLIETFSRIWEADKRTVIFVTHDVDESLLLGHEIIVFSKAPVKIVSRQTIKIPATSRSLDSETLKELKHTLLSALGNKTM
jgi:NitT/TauT family transport system ATP-binding protein